MNRIQELPNTSSDLSPRDLVLVIGMERGSLPDFTGGLQRTRCEYLPFTLLHAALSSAPFAKHVVSPLVAEHFDAMDLAHELQRVGFRGVYSVIVPALPRPEIVTRELRQICPGIKVQLIPRASH